jgi:adiponectin receptor
MPPSRRARSSSRPRRAAAAGAALSPPPPAAPPPPPASSSSSSPPPLPWLLSYDDVAGSSLLRHLADNEFVRGGYRRPMALLPALRSAFSLHNETANVWTHAVGALAFFLALLFALAGGHGFGSGGWLPAADAVAALAERAKLPLHLKHGHAATHAHDAAAAAATVAAAAAAAASAGAGAATPAAPVWPIGVFLASAVVCMGSSAAFHLLHVVNVRTFELLARFDYVGIAVLIAGAGLCVPLASADS